MDSGMPFLRPMGPDALQRGPQKAEKPAPQLTPAREEPVIPEPVQETPAPDWSALPLDTLWPEELLGGLLGQTASEAQSTELPPAAGLDSLWEPETDNLLADLAPAEDDWPEDGEDAVPTESMPTPACVPTLPPLTVEKQKRSWPVALLAIPLGLAVGYAAYRLGWMKLILQALEEAADWLQSLFAR